jgi:hypothetical protein
MYFGTKSYLKSIHNHTVKHTRIHVVERLKFFNILKFCWRLSTTVSAVLIFIFVILFSSNTLFREVQLHKSNFCAAVQVRHGSLQYQRPKLKSISGA